MEWICLKLTFYNMLSEYVITQIKILPIIYNKIFVYYRQCELVLEMLWSDGSNTVIRLIHFT